VATCCAEAADVFFSQGCKLQQALYPGIVYLPEHYKKVKMEILAIMKAVVVLTVMHLAKCRFRNNT
jgi:hypothetical protein